MRIYQEADYDAMSRRAANIIAAEVIRKPNCVLGLAKGSTPVGTYKNLIEMYNKGDLSFKEVKSVNLDEYKGLAPTHDQSYRYFMQDNLFDHVDICPENTNVPDGLAEDPDAECVRYDELTAALGYADLQLLGLGHNGHIGFNEPADVFPLETNCVDLQASTIEANKRFFESEADVPRQAYTMGIGNIMQANKIVVVVSGKDKAKILREVVCGPITPRVPASVLQLHPDVTIVADEAALSVLDAE